MMARPTTSASGTRTAYLIAPPRRHRRRGVVGRRDIGDPRRNLADEAGVEKGCVGTGDLGSAWKEADPQQRASEDPEIPGFAKRRVGRPRRVRVERAEQDAPEKRRQGDRAESEAD